MQKDSRLKVLLLLLLLVFVVALYLITKKISSAPSEVAPPLPSSELNPSLYEYAESPAQKMDAVFSGIIIAVEGSQLTLQEKKTIVTPGPTPELNTTVVSENTISVVLTENTQYRNIAKEELGVGKEVSIGAKELSQDPFQYEAVSIEMKTSVEMEDVSRWIK